MTQLAKNSVAPKASFHVDTSPTQKETQTQDLLRADGKQYAGIWDKDTWSWYMPSSAL